MANLQPKMSNYDNFFVWYGPEIKTKNSVLPEKQQKISSFFRPPVIYLTSNTYLEIGHHLCTQLGLPLSTVRVIQGTNQQQMEEMIAEDKAAGKLPTLCIANVHSSLYQVYTETNLSKLKHL